MSDQLSYMRGANQGTRFNHKTALDYKNLFSEEFGRRRPFLPTQDAASTTDGQTLFCTTYNDIGSGRCSAVEDIEACRVKGCKFCDLVSKGMATITKMQISGIILGLDSHGPILRGRIVHQTAPESNVEIHRVEKRKTSTVVHYG